MDLFLLLLFIASTLMLIVFGIGGFNESDRKIGFCGFLVAVFSLTLLILNANKVKYKSTVPPSDIYEQIINGEIVQFFYVDGSAQTVQKRFGKTLTNPKDFVVVKSHAIPKWRYNTFDPKYALIPRKDYKEEVETE